MADAQTDASEQATDADGNAYWKQAPQDNQATYRHFIGLLKFGVIAGAIVLAFLAAVRPTPL